MSELEKLHRTLLAWKSEGQRMALATVVSIQGSAYRRPGARMLISERGDCTGIIGGGCFDANVREIGYQVMRSGHPELHLYQMAGADPWGLGMGCTGSVYVLVESLQEPDGSEWIREVEEALRRGEVLSIAHRMSRPMDYNSSSVNGEVGLSRRYSRERVTANRRDAARQASAPDPHVFVERIQPAPRLTVFGAGNDVIPLVEYAYQAGFRITVVDQRGDLLHRGRFRHAAEFVHAWPNDYAAKINPASGEYVVMMSHRLENDAEAFRLYSCMRPAYLGFLGPRNRTERILHHIVRIDKALLDSVRGAIHAPIGLDLGAETAEEVALSVVAELLAVRSRRVPQFLRDRAGDIHNTSGDLYDLVTR